MSWGRQFLLWLIGLSAVTLVITVSTSEGGHGTSGLDKRSYLHGYHDSFGDAYLPRSDEDRQTVEGRCQELWSRFPGTGDYNEKSWVTGCADFVEQKKSRF
ncbi:hypothetical protein AB0F03_24085 [Streptomyces sp. NPDC028722]|uniref:hypothetical protein n=1 Tax=Streptomyces sp. NPDC028722 TaxID=3155016 RepID=UPI0033E424B2